MRGVLVSARALEALFFVLVLHSPALVGCTTEASPSQPPPSSGDGGVAADAEGEAGDGAASGPFCSTTLDAFCAKVGVTCERDWQAAMRAAITPPSYCSGRSDGVLTEECGEYEVLESRGVDTGEDDYYEKSTGSLVAIVALSANCGCSTCLGGPVAFAPVTSCGPAVSACPGADGGEGGASDGSAREASQGD